MPQEIRLGQPGLARTLVRLSIPTILEEILATLVQYVDTAMVGRLGEQATAAVSLSATITWLVNSASGAAGVAVLTLIAQSMGAGDRERCAKLSQQALLLSMAAGLVLGAVSVALSPFIPAWMGAEPAIWAEASRYFLIISLPMLFRSASAVLGAAIRATQNTRVPMIINLGSNLLNAGLNYVLIYSCSLGVAGAAIATAVSHVLSGTLMFLAYRRQPLLRWNWKSFSPDRALLRRCAEVGGPVLGTNLASCLGYVVFAGMVSGMGTTVFAAHSIAVTAETIFYIPGYGLRTATSALVGAAVGEKDGEKLRAYMKLSVLLTLVMMCLSGLLLYFVAEPLMAFFTPVAPVIELGAEMLRLVAFSEPFFGLMVVLEGVFYGLGRTRYAFAVDTGSMWGVRILLTLLCVRVFRLDLLAVWRCMIADNVCKALLFALPFLSPRSRGRLLSESLGISPERAAR